MYSARKRAKRRESKGEGGREERKGRKVELELVLHLPVEFCSHASVGYLEQAVRTVVAGDLYLNASIASDRVAFLAEVQVVKVVEVRGGGR